MAEKLNDPSAAALCEAIGAELERQHEQTGITEGLVMTRTEEAGVVRLDGRLDLHALTDAVMRHGLGQAYKALVGYDPFEDDPSQTVAEVQELLAGVAAEAKAAEQTQLAEAEWLIREMSGHEGAEGWSDYLSKRLDAYQFTTKAEGQTDGAR